MPQEEQIPPLDAILDGSGVRYYSKRTRQSTSLEKKLEAAREAYNTARKEHGLPEPPHIHPASGSAPARRSATAIAANVPVSTAALRREIRRKAQQVGAGGAAAAGADTDAGAGIVTAPTSTFASAGGAAAAAAAVSSARASTAARTSSEAAAAAAAAATAAAAGAGGGTQPSPVAAASGFAAASSGAAAAGRRAGRSDYQRYAYSLPGSGRGPVVVPKPYHTEARTFFNLSLLPGSVAELSTDSGLYYTPAGVTRRGPGRGLRDGMIRYYQPDLGMERRERQRSAHVEMAERLAKAQESLGEHIQSLVARWGPSFLDKLVAAAAAEAVGGEAGRGGGSRGSGTASGLNPHKLHLSAGGVNVPVSSADALLQFERRCATTGGVGAGVGGGAGGRQWQSSPPPLSSLAPAAGTNASGSLGGSAQGARRSRIHPHVSPATYERAAYLADQLKVSVDTIISLMRRPGSSGAARGGVEGSTGPKRTGSTRPGSTGPKRTGPPVVGVGGAHQSRRIEILPSRKILATPSPLESKPSASVLAAAAAAAAAAGEEEGLEAAGGDPRRDGNTTAGAEDALAGEPSVGPVSSAAGSRTASRTQLNAAPEGAAAAAETGRLASRGSQGVSDRGRSHSRGHIQLSMAAEGVGGGESGGAEAERGGGGRLTPAPSAAAGPGSSGGANASPPTVPPDRAAAAAGASGGAAAPEAAAAAAAAAVAGGSDGYGPSAVGGGAEPKGAERPPDGRSPAGSPTLHQLGPAGFISRRLRAAGRQAGMATATPSAATSRPSTAQLRDSLAGDGGSLAAAAASDVASPTVYHHRSGVSYVSLGQAMPAGPSLEGLQPADPRQSELEAASRAALEALARRHGDSRKSQLGRDSASPYGGTTGLGGTAGPSRANSASTAGGASRPGTSGGERPWHAHAAAGGPSQRRRSRPGSRAGSRPGSRPGSRIGSRPASRSYSTRGGLGAIEHRRLTTGLSGDEVDGGPGGGGVRIHVSVSDRSDGEGGDGTGGEGGRGRHRRSTGGRRRARSGREDEQAPSPPRSTVVVVITTASGESSPAAHRISGAGAGGRGGGVRSGAASQASQRRTGGGGGGEHQAGGGRPLAEIAGAIGTRIEALHRRHSSPRSTSGSGSGLALLMESSTERVREHGRRVEYDEDGRSSSSSSNRSSVSGASGTFEDGSCGGGGGGGGGGGAGSGGSRAASPSAATAPLRGLMHAWDAGVAASDVAASSDVISRPTSPSPPSPSPLSPPPTADTGDASAATASVGPSANASAGGTCGPVSVSPVSPHRPHRSINVAAPAYQPGSTQGLSRHYQLAGTRWNPAAPGALRPGYGTESDYIAGTYNPELVERVAAARDVAAMTGEEMRVDYKSPVYSASRGGGGGGGGGLPPAPATGNSSDSLRREAQARGAAGARTPVGPAAGAAAAGGGGSPQAPAAPRTLDLSLLSPAGRAAAAKAKAAVAISELLNPVSRAIANTTILAAAAGTELPPALQVLTHVRATDGGCVGGAAGGGAHTTLHLTPGTPLAGVGGGGGGAGNPACGSSYGRSLSPSLMRPSPQSPASPSTAAATAAAVRYLLPTSMSVPVQPARSPGGRRSSPDGLGGGYRGGPATVRLAGAADLDAAERVVPRLLRPSQSVWGRAEMDEHDILQPLNQHLAATAWAASAPKGVLAAVAAAGAGLSGRWTSTSSVSSTTKTPAPPASASAVSSASALDRSVRLVATAPGGWRSSPPGIPTAAAAAAPESRLWRGDVADLTSAFPKGEKVYRLVTDVQNNARLLRDMEKDITPVEFRNRTRRGVVL